MTSHGIRRGTGAGGFWGLCSRGTGFAATAQNSYYWNASSGHQFVERLGQLVDDDGRLYSNGGRQAATIPPRSTPAQSMAM